MKKKGFTLIELLAVIVILAIIALIATPAVLNIIEDSRKGAAEASARNIVSAAKTYYMSETMKGNTPSNIDLSGTTLKYDGDQATKGTITFEGGKASGKMYVGGYCVEVAVDGKVESEKAEEDECTIEVSVPEVTYTKYNDGTPLLYDPVNNVKCEISIGSTTGTNDGCMKWYAFLDSETSSTVNLILDHNTTDDVAWNEYEGVTPDTVNAELQTDVTNWNDAVKSTARLISATEINAIAPVEGENIWDVNDENTGYYLTVDTSENVTYDWLYENTGRYWTSTLVGISEFAWAIYADGWFHIDRVDSNTSGVRPVITVSKDVFK